MAGSWSACFKAVSHLLHQASPQAASSWGSTISGALQCWCGQDRNIHRTGHHATEDGNRGRSQGLWFCNSTEEEEDSHGSEYSEWPLDHCTVSHTVCHYRLSTYTFMMLYQNTLHVETLHSLSWMLMLHWGNSAMWTRMIKVAFRDSLSYLKSSVSLLRELILLKQLLIWARTATLTICHVSCVHISVWLS